MGLLRHFRSTAFAALTIACVAIPSALMVQAFTAYRTAAETIASASELNGEIRYLDEVLTMSARMAAASGDRQWVERYESHVEELTTAINDYLALADSADIAAMVDATNEANDALVAMETRAFALAARGRRAQALALLMSPEYRGQKYIYANGMERAEAAGAAAFALDARRTAAELAGWGICAVVGLILCFSAWLISNAHFVREQAMLQQALRDERDAATSASSAKSIFLANMSHELRTPLNAIIGYSEMLRETAAEQARSQDAADHDRVLSAGRSLLRLVNDLLDLSKAEAGKIDLGVEQFEVRDIIKSAIATIEPSANARGNRVVVEVSADIGVARTDDFRLSQCLLNLLSNAAKFTQDGEIKLTARRVRRGRDELEFVVSDTGVGIAAADLAHLFEPFVQGEAATARAYGGTGLGLAITRTLANLMGGDITVSSQLGKGSCFTLRIPVVLDAIDAPPLTQAA